MHLVPPLVTQLDHWLKVTARRRFPRPGENIFGSVRHQPPVVIEGQIVSTSTEPVGADNNLSPAEATPTVSPTSETPRHEPNTLIHTKSRRGVKVVCTTGMVDLTEPDV